MSSRAASRWAWTSGSFSDGVEEPVVLGVHGLGVDLVEDAVQHRLDPAPGVLGADAHQVDGVVGAAPLPGRAGQVRPDRVDQPGVRVGGDQRDPGQAAGDEVLEEGVPAGAGLGGGGGDAEDLAVARRR